MANTGWEVRSHHDEGASPVLAPEPWPQVEG